MRSCKIGILEPDGFSVEALAKLKQLGQVDLFSGQSIQLAAFLSDMDVLFIRLAYRIDAGFLQQAPCLKVLCTPTTGLTHLSEPDLRTRGITVLSLQGEQEFLQQIRATPEHALGLALSLLRNYRVAFRSVDRSEWDRDSCRGNEICGRTIGLIGFGRVGRLLAKYFSALDARVVFYDPDPAIAVQYGAERMGSIEKLIDASDVVVLCAAFHEANRGLIDRRKIDLMQGKFIINIARGELIDEAYLIDKINEGFFAGVALDVIEQENQTDNRLPLMLPLTDKHNFILTPHIAGATFESMAKTEVFVVEKLARFLDGDGRALTL